MNNISFIIVIAVIVLFVIVLVWILDRADKKSTNRLTNGINTSFLESGIKASIVQNPERRWESVPKVTWKIENRSFNFAIFISVKNSNDCLDWVITDFQQNKEKARTETVLFLVKDKGVWGNKVLDIYWTGNTQLAQSLNADTRLKEAFIENSKTSARLDETAIFYDVKSKETVIRNPINVPTPLEIEIIEKIAQHIKANTQCKK